TGLDVKNLAVEAITKFPIALHGDVSGGDGIRKRPLRQSRNFKVLKRTGPGFYGVGGDQRVPMQLVDRKIDTLDGGQDAGEAHVLHMRNGAKLDPVEKQGDAAFHRSTERGSHKIGDFEAFVVHAKAATAGKASGAKNRVGQDDVVAGVTSGAVQLAIGKRTFP